jgi:hypothetical protein
MPVSIGAVALVGLAAAIALEPAEESLVWEAPPGSACPSAREVHDRLARLLGGEASPVRAQARAQAHASGWRVELVLHWQGHRDARTIVADRCETLADATVLMVAATADPVVALHYVHVAPPPEPHPIAVVPVPVRPRVAASPPSAFGPGRTRPRARDRGLAIGVLGLLDLGALPRLAAGWGASVGWRWPRARLFAEGSYLPAQSVPSAAPNARQGRVQLGTARAGGCARLWLRAVELPLCGGVEAGSTRATGFGVRADLEASDPWLAVFAHGSLAIPLMPRLAVVGRVEVAVPLVFSEYVFADERLYRARAVVVRGGLGLEFRWGQQNAGRPEKPRGG